MCQNLSLVPLPARSNFGVSLRTDQCSACLRHRRFLKSYLEVAKRAYHTLGAYIVELFVADDVRDGPGTNEMEPLRHVFHIGKLETMGNLMLKDAMHAYECPGPSLQFMRLQKWCRRGRNAAEDPFACAK